MPSAWHQAKNEESDAARHLLVTEGYRATAVRTIVDRAGVNVDTVYRSIGRKSDVVRAVVESSLSGLPEAVPAERRDYVQRILAATSATAKLEIYAAAIVDIQQRLAPVYRALIDAARSDQGSRQLWQEISERRATNMRDFAVNLRATGELRADVDNETVADIIWAMNGTEYWTLLVERRGWTPERFRLHLVDAWRRLLLADTE